MGTRINTNISALNALKSLNDIGNRLSTAQLRLSTGKRINAAADDAAGYSIAKKFNARAEGLGQALNNIGSAKNLVSVAEGLRQKSWPLRDRNADSRHARHRAHDFAVLLASGINAQRGVGCQKQILAACLLGSSNSRCYGRQLRSRGAVTCAGSRGRC